MKITKGIKSLIIALFWLLLWQVLAMAVASPLLLPGPADTLKGLFSLMGSSDFYVDIIYTVVRCVLAIVLALIFGAVLSLVSYRIPIVRDVLSLPVALFKSVPIMAVAIYMIFLLSAGNVPVLVCFIMCFPIVYTNLLTGLDSMNREYYEMAAVYKLSDGDIIRHIYAPQMFPYFKSAISIITGMSWKAVVTAEVLSIPKFSLGYELMNAKYYLNTERLFAYVATIVAVSLIFERIVKALIDKFDMSHYHLVPRFGNKKTDAGEKLAAESTSGKGEKNLPAEDAPEIEFRDIFKAFDGRQVLNGFSAKLGAGKTTMLMGPSGSGKTTLARILLGLEQADSGEVKICRPDQIGLRIGSAESEQERSVVKTKIGVLFQEDRLLPWLDVYDNLALIRRDASEDEIVAMLDSVGLKGEYHKMPNQLSGGMSHRVAMARMFLYGAPLMVADEPFRGLDDDTRDEVIRDAWRPNTKGKTVLLISHDADLAGTLADETINMTE